MRSKKRIATLMILVVLGYKSYFYDFEVTSRIKELPKGAHVEPLDTNIHDSRSRNVSLLKAVEKYAVARTILVALVDIAFLDMALNFHETSLEPHHINNYLFLSTSKQCCQEMEKRSINCFTYVDDDLGKNASRYHSIEFNRKMLYRTLMLIEILKAGFTVLVSDVDIIFLKNPYDFIDCDSECEIRCLMDESWYNAGFIYIRPTNKTIQLYKGIQESLGDHTINDDQYFLKMVVKKMKKRNESVAISGLPTEQFLCGKYYFEHGNSQFAGDNKCSQCVVVHNNYIVGKVKKVYREKEHHFWVYDGNGYYSNPNAKYLTYDNPVCGEYDHDLKHSELKALKNALIFSKILKRILILPKFTCRSGPCNILTKLDLNLFDEIFHNMYREHSFLGHPKVPKQIKQGLSGVYKIKDEYVNKADCLNSSIKTKTYLMLDKALTDLDILNVFGNMDTPVIQFYSMYDTFAGFNSSSVRESIDSLMNKIF